MATRNRKILLTTLVVGATTAVAGTGVFAAFTAQVTNTGNNITSGTVSLTENSLGVALYNVSNQAPGATLQRCIHVQYTGSLPSTVKLYRPTAVTNGTAFNLTVERGSGLSGTMPACTGFTPTATIYTGTLGAFGNTYATGVDAKGSAWATNDAVDYRFTVSVVDDPTPGAHTTSLTTGTHTYTWEARSN